MTQKNSENSGNNMQDKDRKNCSAPEDAALDSILKATLDNLQAALVLVDEQGHILFGNKIWWEIGHFYSWCEEEHQWWEHGCYLSECEKKTGNKYQKKICSELKKVLKGENQYFRVDYPGVLNPNIWFNVSANHVILPDGRHGMVVAHLEITNRKQGELELQKTAHLLDINEEIAFLGSFKHNPQSGRISWTKGLKRLFEVPLDFTPNLDSIKEFISEEALDKVSKAVDQNNDKPFDLELDITTRKGNLKHVRIRGEHIVDASGKTNFVGIFQDITQTIKQQRQREQLITKLKKRIKEFYCLYQASEAIQSSSNESELMNSILSLIPKSWSLPQAHLRPGIPVHGKLFHQPFPRIKTATVGQDHRGRSRRGCH